MTVDRGADKDFDPSDVLIVFLDTETTGLDPDIHQVWEMGWIAMDSAGRLGELHSSFVRHTLLDADPKALEVGRHAERLSNPSPWAIYSIPFERELEGALTGVTLCAANPAFDAAFLTKRWFGKKPWRYRMLDIETYAMAALDSPVPVGLHAIIGGLQQRYDVEFTALPDHSAGNDALSVAEAYKALQTIYKKTGLGGPHEA